LLIINILLYWKQISDRSSESIFQHAQTRWVGYLAGWKDRGL